MGEAPTQGLLIAASLSITCTLIALGVFLMHSGESVATTFSNKLNALNSTISTGDLTKYDHVTIKGTDVVNCIRQHRNDVEIIVNKMYDTNNHFISQSYDHTLSSFINTPADALDDTNPTGYGNIYINPNADFVGTVRKNANGVITALEFNQVAFVSDATTVPQDNTTIIINNGGSGGVGGGGDSSALADALAGFQTSVLDFLREQTNSNDGNLAETVSSLSNVLLNLTGEDGMLKEIKDLLLANSGLNSGGSEGSEGSEGAINDLDSVMMKLNEIYAYIQNGGLNFDDVEDSTTLAELITNLRTCSTYMARLENTMIDGHASIAASIDNLGKLQTERFDNLDDKVDDLSDSIDELTKTVTQLETEIKDLKNSIILRPYGALYTPLSSFNTSLKDSCPEYDEMVSTQYAGTTAAGQLPYLLTNTDSESLNEIASEYNKVLRVYDASCKLNYAHESLDTVIDSLEKVQASRL